MTELDIAHVGEDVPLLEGMRTCRALRRLRAERRPVETCLSWERFGGGSESLGV